MPKPKKHKRKKAKQSRGGCLLCKPHKCNHTKLAERLKFGDYRRQLKAEDTNGDV